MAKKASTENYTDDEASSASALDSLMDQDISNLPDVLDTIPVGTWKLRGKNGAFKEAQGEQNAKFLFFLLPVEPKEDVDPEALAAAGADYDYTNNQIVVTKYVQNLREVRAVLAILKGAFGVDMDGLTPKQAIKKIAGKEVVATVGTRSYKNRDGIDVNENTATNFTAAE